MPVESGKNDKSVGDVTGEFTPEDAGARTDPDTDNTPGSLPATDGTGESPPAAPPHDQTEQLTGYYVDSAPTGSGGKAVPRQDVPKDVATDPLGATGEYVPGPTEDLTGEYIPGQREGTEGGGTDAVTGEYLPGDVRQQHPGGIDFLEPPPTGATEHAVGESLRYATLRRIANLTNPGGSAIAADSPLKIGRYRFQKVQGKGGMGEVWLADDLVIGRPVAIKRILKKRKELEERFVQEAQVTGQLEHPGIVPVHELSVDEAGQPYYVMKFVEGQTLQKVIAEYHAASAGGEAKEVQLHRLLSIFVTLCQTVAYAHSRGVIHRDLKPDNVMVGSYGETLLLDWGLAKVVGSADPDAPVNTQLTLSGLEESMPTMMGAAKGTPTYFSPEAAAGLIGEIDHVSDVYLLGGTLYHILTGKPPRHADKVRQLLELAVTKPPDPPRKLKPEVPRALEAICVKALAHQKRDRYQTAAALAQDMQRYLAGEPVSAYRESLLQRAWRWTRKHRKTLARGAAAAIVLGTLITGYLLISAAERRSAEAERLAGKLQAEDQARQDVEAFRAAAEEARFYAALADQMTDNAPVLDVARALDKGNEALKRLAGYGETMESLPLEESRPVLAREAYELLLEMAQVNVHLGGVDGHRAALATLDRAAKLGTAPTQSFYRLRGHCLMTLALEDRGAADAKKASDPAVGTTALDHYLLGEQARRDSVRPGKGRQVREVKGKQVAQPGSELLNKAIEQYRRALALNPEHYWSHYKIGVCHVALQHGAEAVEAFGACVALAPRAPWSYTARAWARTALGHFKGAHADVEQALKLEPDFRHALLYRGGLYLKENEYAKAAEDFTTLLEMPPDKRLMEAAMSRAEVYLKEHQRAEPGKASEWLKKAAADFDRLEEAKVDLRTAFLHRARVYLVEKKPELCLENLTNFLSGAAAGQSKETVLPEDRARELRTLVNELPVGAVEGRALAYELILAELERALKQGRASAKVYGEIGAAEQLLAGLRPKEAGRRLREAVTAYSKGIELDAKDVKLRIKRGWTYVDFNESAPARDDFQAAVALEPDNAEAHTGLGYTLASLKTSAAAQRHANRAILHGGGDYLILHNVACIYAVIAKNEGRKEYQDLAIDQLERALAIWRDGGMTEPNELRLIQGESAFDPVLRKRPEFERLLKSP